MKKTTLVALFGLAAASAFAQTTPAGLWKTIDDDTKQEKSLVRITENNGVFSGRIEKLLDPKSKPDAVCEKCSDDRKDKPIVGMEIIRNVKKDGDVWAGGTILDSAKGKVYKVKITMADGGKMPVRFGV